MERLKKHNKDDHQSNKVGLTGMSRELYVFIVCLQQIIMPFGNAVSDIFNKSFHFVCIGTD